MWRYRLKVILLALGVVLGYGSALHHHGYCGHRHFMHGWSENMHGASGNLQGNMHGDSCAGPTWWNEWGGGPHLPSQNQGDNQAKPVH